MRDEELYPLVADPDLTTDAAGRALLGLAEQYSGGDPDIAGDVVIYLAERLRPGNTLRDRLADHPSPPALLNAAARNASRQFREAARANKRAIPLTLSGETAELDRIPAVVPASVSLFDVLADLGWQITDLQTLALPRKRAGRSIHPGIEDAVQHLARCFGITERCDGCPTPMDLQRMNLTGPEAWPILVPVLEEWGWSDALITHLTTRPDNIAHWRSTTLPPAPARQERRMVEIARKMRWEPWLLSDPDTIRQHATPPSAKRRPPGVKHRTRAAPEIACRFGSTAL